MKEKRKTAPYLSQKVHIISGFYRGCSGWVYGQEDFCQVYQVFVYYRGKGFWSKMFRQFRGRVITVPLEYFEPLKESEK